MILWAVTCALLPAGLARSADDRPAPLKIAVSYSRTLEAGPVDGRLLLLMSNDASAEPRFQIADGPSTQQAFGIDLDGWAPGAADVPDTNTDIYVGDMDSYYLNNAVYLIEDVLKGQESPPYGGEVDYGDRAEHCWNGDHTRPNAISRLRYHQMYLPKIVERLLNTVPPGGDVTSWKY